MTTNVTMSAGQLENNTREIFYAHGYHDYDAVGPVLTRYHRGEWRPAVRQYIFGNPRFSTWRSLHGTYTSIRQIDRTNANRAHIKPVRLWDQSAYPASYVPTTYVPNPSQLSVGNINSSYTGGGFQTQDAYSSWYSRFGK